MKEDGEEIVCVEEPSLEKCYHEVCQETGALPVVKEFDVL